MPQLFGPTICAPGEEVKIIIPRLVVATMQAWVLTPPGAEINISSQLNTRALGATMVDGMVLNYTPTFVGTHIFVFYDPMAVAWYHWVFQCSRWAGNIDQSITNVVKQRVEIERVRNVLKEPR